MVQVQGKITEADTLTVRDQLVAHFCHLPIFMPDALPAATVALYPIL